MEIVMISALIILGLLVLVTLSMLYLIVKSRSMSSTELERRMRQFTVLYLFAAFVVFMITVFMK